VGGIFEAKEPWNTPVDQDPADPSSQAIIDWLSQNGGWGGGNFQIDFSITLQYADASTPMMPFTKSGDFYSPDCDDIPAFPVPNGGAIEGESGYACNGDGDCHLLVVDKAQGKLYEMWRAFAPPDATVFNGGCSVVWDLKKAYPANLRGDGCTSADAGGFPISAMLFTADEVAAGHIDHAIRFILPNSRIRGGDVYVHPGTHTTGATSGGANAPPYGVRFRLKPTFDLNKLPSDGARVVAKALQKYGMFLSDGGNIALTAADDRFTTAKWADANVNVDSHALYAIQVSDFEVVDMGTPVPYTGDCTRNP
jgi:serine/threonine-protein kinase